MTLCTCSSCCLVMSLYNVSVFVHVMCRHPSACVNPGVLLSDLTTRMLVWSLLALELTECTICQAHNDCCYSRLVLAVATNSLLVFGRVHVLREGGGAVCGLVHIGDLFGGELVLFDKILTNFHDAIDLFLCRQYFTLCGDAAAAHIHVIKCIAYPAVIAEFQLLNFCIINPIRLSLCFSSRCFDVFVIVCNVFDNYYTNIVCFGHLRSSVFVFM